MAKLRSIEDYLAHPTLEKGGRCSEAHSHCLFARLQIATTNSQKFENSEKNFTGRLRLDSLDYL